MIIVFEALGLLAVLSVVVVAVQRRFPIPKRARMPLFWLLFLLAFNHVANIIEQLGGMWADSIADALAGATPFVWGLFLVEVGRSYLNRQVALQAEQLRFLLERVPASVAWLDGEQHVLAVSRVWEKQLPNSSGRLLSEALPASLPQLSQALHDCLRNGSLECQGEDQGKDASQRMRYFRWSLRRVDDPDQERAGALLILEETTLSIEAEAERTAAIEDLARAQRAADLAELAAGAAHDLNNMLLVVGAAADELADVAAAEPASREIRQAVEAASAMTRMLLRLGAHRAPSLSQLNLTALLEQVEGLLKIALGRKHTLLVSKPSEPIWISGDAARLEHAILNLVVNARDASPAGGPIHLSLAVTEGVARLTVKDEGLGMPEAVRAQLFRPFFTTKGPRGTGLGLVSVKSTVSQHGGTISVESWPGAGSAFELRIPLAYVPGLPPERAS